MYENLIDNVPMLKTLDVRDKYSAHLIVLLLFCPHYKNYNMHKKIYGFRGL